MANQAAGTTLNELGKITKIISGLSGAFSSAEKIYQFLNNDTPTDRILNALQTLETAVLDELNAIEKELENQTLQDELKPYKKKIKDIQVSTANISTDFSTLKKNEEGYYIGSSKNIPLDEWAVISTGPDSSLGALDILWNNMKSVWDLFQSGGAADPSLLTIWGNLFDLGASDNIQNFVGQHKLSAYFMFLQQINGMIGQIFYLHEAILGLYTLAYPANTSRNSLSSRVEDWFGSYDQEGSVWYMFDQAMTFNQTIFDDFNLISTSVDSGSNTNVDNGLKFVRMADPGTPGGSYIWTKEFSVTDLNFKELGIDNAFITDIRLVSTSDNYQDFPKIYLQGSVSTMLDGGGIEFVGDFSSFDSSAEYNDPNLTQFPFPGYADDDGGWYVNTGYSVPGRVTDNVNKFYVVTGFKLGTWTHGPNTEYYSTYLTIVVQSAILDVTNINSPTVSGYTDFVYNQKSTSGFVLFGRNNDHDPYTIPPSVEFWNLNGAGNASGFPIDDLSLARVHNAPKIWNGNEVGLLARSNFTIHRADFMQPKISLVPYGFK